MNSQNELDINNISNVIIANRNAEYPFIPAGSYVRNIKVNGAYTYVGYSAAKADESTESWVIKRIYENGGDTKIRYAVDVKWDDVLTTTYDL